MLNTKDKVNILSLSLVRDNFIQGWVFEVKNRYCGNDDKTW